MSTLGSSIKEYPPLEHTLSHDSNPQAARISAVRQKIKDDAVQTLTKPTKVPSDDSEHVFNEIFRL